MPFICLQLYIRMLWCTCCTDTDKQCSYDRKAECQIKMGHIVRLHIACLNQSSAYRQLQQVQSDYSWCQRCHGMNNKYKGLLVQTLWQKTYKLWHQKQPCQSLPSLDRISNASLKANTALWGWRSGCVCRACILWCISGILKSCGLPVVNLCDSMCHSLNTLLLQLLVHTAI